MCPVVTDPGTREVLYYSRGVVTHFEARNTVADLVIYVVDILLPRVLDVCKILACYAVIYVRVFQVSCPELCTNRC
jgi:hypothetical protein